MDKLTRTDLLSLEQYAEQREAFRARVLAHKKPRNVALGEHLTLYFEDRLTIHYQVQEMLRVEKIFTADEIQQELDAYNPLIPDGGNFKATVMIEYADVAERRRALAELVGIEDRIWLQVGDHDKVYAISDEDMQRTEMQKTSAVHFSRFELTAEMISDLHAGADLAAGCDHPRYQHTFIPLEEATRTALVADLQ